MKLPKSLFFSGSALLLGACQSLPDLSQRSVSTYIDTESSPRLEAALPSERPSEKETGQTGVYLLADPHDAFVARAILIGHADHTLDIAYYIWHDDVSGKMLFQMLQQAARRGVRVRLLLDDNNTRGMDDTLAALDAEENIEIRLFNPFTHRKFRALGYLTDFPRLNRRMHNKSLTADNRYAIIGGRNVGDEYFNVSTETGFADLDVLAKGAVVTDISRDFDRYWASGSSYPFPAVAKHANAEKGRLKYGSRAKKTPRYAKAILTTSKTPRWPPPYPPAKSPGFTPTRSLSATTPSKVSRAAAKNRPLPTSCSKPSANRNRICSSSPPISSPANGAWKPCAASPPKVWA